MPKSGTELTASVPPKRTTLLSKALAAYTALSAGFRSNPHQYSHAPIASCDPGCDCTTRQEDQPLIGLVFFCVLPRVCAGSCGFLWTSFLRSGARIWPFPLSPGHSSLRPRCPLLGKSGVKNGVFSFALGKTKDPWPGPGRDWRCPVPARLSGVISLDQRHLADCPGRH